MRDRIIEKLKKSHLTGRGGGCFPVWQKWVSVHSAPGERKFVVCNASEGEPDVRKDLHILDKEAHRVIDGMKLAIYYLHAEKGFFYLNPLYYDRLAKLLSKAIGTAPIEIFKKPHNAGYIGGEETSLLNTMEGGRTEPRIRPPFPVTYGLGGYPTLIHNVETFYDISLIAANAYQHKRFFSIAGDVIWAGVYELPEDMHIDKILLNTDNWPKFPFFVQVGGGASGQVLNISQLKSPATGAGSITVYSIEKHSPIALIRHWIRFFERESCGQCTPCREGTYRLNEIVHSSKPDWETFAQLLVNLKDTAFCGLGCAVPIPISSFIRNVMPHYPSGRLEIPDAGSRLICECFKNN